MAVAEGPVADGANMLDEDLIPKMVISLAVVLAFIIFITVDAVRALKRKAHWIPGDFLVLSAITIMLLNSLSDEGELVKAALRNQKHSIIETDLWMAHTSRVMVCVVVAYLLPGMASPGSESMWRNLFALAITILVHMFSELFIASSSPFLKPQLCGAVLISCSLILLIILLGCAYVASKGIEVILAQRIPLILSSSIVAEEYTWETVENEVFKASIVARAYSPEHIIAKSALSSSAAAIVTVQILISTLGMLIKGPRVEFHSIFDFSKFIATMLQCVFILIGWAIIGWRWCTSVAYYSKFRGDDGDTFCSRLWVEDFWTRHIEEQLAQERERSEADSLSKRFEDLNLAKQPFKIRLPGKLLRLLLGIQWIMALFSKTCWALSLLVFNNRFVYGLLSYRLDCAFKDYSKYEEVLKGLEMMGETPRSLWLANRKTIAKAKQLFKVGEEDGKKSTELIEFLTGKRTSTCSSLSCLYPRAGLKYLYKLNPPPLEVEKYFMDVNKLSWKMKATSLISLAIKLSPKVGEICLNVYSQAWEVIDFVEKTDAEAEGIMGEAADRFFYTLRESLIKQKNAYADTISPAAVIGKLATKNEKKTRPSGGRKFQGDTQQDWETDANIHKVEEKSIIPMQRIRLDDWRASEARCSRDGAGGNDSIDWKKAAAATAVYKLCKSIDCNINIDLNVLLEEIQCSLADIISICLCKIKSALIVNSRKWARKIEENKLEIALYTAGKAKALMKELGGDERVGWSC